MPREQPSLLVLGQASRGDKWTLSRLSLIVSPSFPFYFFPHSSPFGFGDKVSHYIAQVSLELKDPPASNSQMQMYASLPGFFLLLKKGGGVSGPAHRFAKCSQS